MKAEKIPSGLFIKWLGDYKAKYPHHNDSWHKYSYLHQRTQQYLNNRKEKLRNRDEQIC